MIPGRLNKPFARLRTDGWKKTAPMTSRKAPSVGFHSEVARQKQVMTYTLMTSWLIHCVRLKQNTGTVRLVSFTYPKLKDGSSVNTLSAMLKAV